MWGTTRSGEPVDGVDRLIPLDELTDAVAHVDAIVVTLPGTDQTHHLIGAEVLSAVKPGVILTNVGRGTVVDEHALLGALDDVAVDAWVAAGHPSDGAEAATCCQDGDLSNAGSALRERIDYVWARGAHVVSATRIGAGPEERTADGLWPSDHAGVVVELELPGRQEAGAPDRERLTARGRS